MSEEITIKKSVYKSLPYSNREESLNINGKGWTYSYVYHFSEIRDVFLALRLFGKYSSLSKFFEFCMKLKLPYVSTPWNSRRLLEVLNSLKNFKLIGKDYEIYNLSTFNSLIGKPLAGSDYIVFKRIFFTYSKFCEIHSWFINPDKVLSENVVITEEVLYNSKTVYAFAKDSRFINTLFFEFENNPTLYTITKPNNEDDEDMVRFWDVYVKWATLLGLIEKINIKNLYVNLLEINKSVSCVYYLKPIDENFDLFNYIKNTYKGTYIKVSNLIYKIAVDNKYSIEDTKNMVIKQCLDKPSLLRFQRTSEAFLEKNEKRLFPKVNGSYVSHILVL